MTTHFKIALFIPAMFAQIALSNSANAGCRESYLAAINQPTNAAESVSDIALASANLTPVAILGVSASATSFTDHLQREHLKDTLQLIEESLGLAGSAIGELATQTGHEPEQVASVIRELDSSNRICADRLLSGDETRLLVVGIVNSI